MNKKGFFLGDIKGSGFIDLRIEALNLIPNAYKFDVNIIKDGRIGRYDMNIKSYYFLIKGGNKVSGLSYLKHNWYLHSKKH